MKKFLHLKWNNITKLGWIFFFSNLYFYSPIITLYYQQRGLNIFQINSLQGIVIATIFLTNIPTGIFTDKYGRKLSMIIALTLQLIGEILFLFAYGYAAFAVICVIAGLGFSFMTGTVTALIYETLKKEGKDREMQKAVGIKASFEKAAGVIAPLAASFYITSFEMTKFRLLVMVTIIFVVISLFLTFFIEEPPHVQQNKKRGDSLKIIKEGLQLLRENKPLKRIILLSVFTYPLMVYLYLVYQPYFVASHVSSNLFGLFLALASFVALLSSRYAHKLEKIFGAEKTVLLVTLLPGLAYLVMAITHQALLSPILFCFVYLMGGLYEPLFADYQNRHIKSDNRATILSMISMFSSLYIVLVGLLIGFVANKSISYAFVLMGLIIVASSIAFRLNKVQLGE